MQVQTDYFGLIASNLLCKLKLVQMQVYQQWQDSDTEWYYSS